jgi:hypothetical protein
MRAQQGVIEDIAQGGLRDTRSNVVTGASINRWLSRNRKVLEQTQSPEAIMRIRQIAAAIGGDPAAAADAFAMEMGPALAMDRLGGAENAILGMMGSHRMLEQLTGARLHDFRNAYSTAIERAMSDPVYARKITDEAARRPRTVPSWKGIRRVLRREALRSLATGAYATTDARVQ